jgi:STAM-binding protein
MRYAALVAEKLPIHPTARDPETRAGMKAAQKTLPEVIAQLEALKPRINERYEKWQKALERKREANAAVQHERPASRSRMYMAASDPAVAGNTTTLAAAENSDLAVKLAHKEIRRRDEKRRATRQAGVTEEEEQERRTAGLWDDWEAALSRDGQPTRPPDDDEMRRQMEDSRRRMDGQHDIVPDGARRRLTKPAPQAVRPVQARNGTSEYHYPSISKPQSLRYEDKKIESRSRSISPPPAYATPDLPPAYLPPKPPKERFDQLYEEPPNRPDKATPEPQDLSMGDLKAPPSFTFRPSAYLENGNPLRTVFLPPTLREQFLKLAASNTRNNLETCGMLCGTLISNALFISRLVIPEQESTSDTCETVNESAFFDYCASEDLMVLGWIHTHPTQTCFMSSRDLHTHCGYQIMMPESIAIVCAPTKNPS